MQNNVPLAVIFDILLHLSVKSLCRYKCVSKHWCSLISDPRFVKRHLNLATVDKDVECQRRKLVVLAVKEEIENKQGKRLRVPTLASSMYHVECEAMSSTDSMAVKIDVPFLSGAINQDSHVKFIGSFNGLLCIRSYASNYFFLFNPAINELKRIHNLYGLPSLCGFGYDHSIDDYNVVLVMHESNVYVYSLKTDTWRAAQNMPYEDRLLRRYRIKSDIGVPLNGAVHWVFDPSYDVLLRRRIPIVIIAFDLAEGKFREMPPPVDAATKVTGVGVLGGCICGLTYKIDVASEQHNFWVMKEYGVKESWTKVFVMDVPFMKLRPLFRKLRPLSYLRNDDVLLEIDGRLVIYNQRELTEKDVLIRGIGGRLETETYVESLVSPNAWKLEMKDMSDEIF